MTTEERIERMDKNLHGLAKVQEGMMDLLGLTVEGERRLATRMERIEELHLEHGQSMKEIDLRLTEIGGTLAETDDRLNALIGVADGFIRGKG